MIIKIKKPWSVQFYRSAAFTENSILLKEKSLALQFQFLCVHVKQTIARFRLQERVFITKQVFTLPQNIITGRFSPPRRSKFFHAPKTFKEYI